jgi:hypothetical protein
MPLRTPSSLRRSTNSCTKKTGTVELISGSTQKQQAEEAHRERSSTQVQFNLDPPKALNNPAPVLAEASPLPGRREHLREWIDSVSPDSPDPTPLNTTGPGNLPRRQDASLQDSDDPSVAVHLKPILHAS